MAGGNKRGSFDLTMAERVALGHSTAAVHATRPPAVDDCPGRHVWVHDPVDRLGESRPGLLYAWHQDPDGYWLGRVVYIVQMRAGAGWATVEEWIPADCLEQVE